MNHVRALAAIFAVAIALSAGAQKFGETLQVDVVEVPVTVVDRDGRAVRGLTKEHFELYDDGKRVAIDYFEVVDIARVIAQSDGETPLPPVTTRNFLLIFDLESSAPGLIARAQEAAKEFIAGGLTRHDLVAVATFSAERGVQLLTSFTADRELVTRAINTLRNPQQFRVADPLMLAALPAEPIVADDEATVNLAAQRFNDVEMRNRLRVQLNHFGRIAQVLDRLHGQKQIVLLSEGFDGRLVHGREELTSQQSDQEREQIFAGEGYRVDNDQRFGNTGAKRDLSEMAELFRRSDVVLHAIDIAGLRSERTSSNESLSLLTTPTGGTVFKNANDLGENFKRMLRQQEVVYVLGFNAKGTGKPGRFHTLKVKTVNAPAARVVHRSGYSETRSELTDLETVLTLSEIITTDLPIDDVPLAISTTAIPGPDGKARVPVVIEIPGPRILEDVPGSTATATLFVYAFDRNGRVADHLQQRIALDLARTGDTLRASGIRYYGTLRVASGDYAIKALVRVEESGHIGFARTDLPVPSFEQAVVLPPMLFEEPRQWVMLTGAARGDDYPYPFAAGNAKYVPRSNPELRNDSEYKLALFLYRMPVEGLGLEPVVTSRDGSRKRAANVSLLGRTSADEHGGTKLLFSFKPEGLQSGEYELQLSVKAPDGAASLVSMPFILR
jgi:VWFA-related protein